MRILCATDLLPKSESAIDRAGLLARRLDADLSLLHVVAPAESERMLQQDLERADGHLKSRARAPLWKYGPTPNVLVRAGNAARVLMDTAAELKADLVVLGMHRKRAARDALAGTIAERMLSERRYPVLIVHHMVRAAYGHVLLALDLSAASVSAVRAAESLVLRDGARASIVHAYEPPYQGMLNTVGIAEDAMTAYSYGWTREAERAVRELLKSASQDSSRYDLIMQGTPAAGAIRSAARRVNPDLLVMGTRGRGRLSRALLGSVATRVLASATTDVLVVPEDREHLPSQGMHVDRRSLGV
jgi:universal stress protein E